MAYLIIANPDSAPTFFAFGGQNADAETSFAAARLTAGGLPFADGADRRADRLSAVHAATDRGEPPIVVAGGDPGRTRLGHPRRDQAGAIKQVVGLFVAVYLIATLDPAAASTANEPVQQFLSRWSRGGWP